MNPTDTINALEKALEAGKMELQRWMWDSDPYVEGRTRYRVVARGRTITQTYYSSADPHALHETQFIAACSPLAIRTLLDAHASALRDAARYRALRMMDWFDGPLCVVSDPKRLFAQPRALGTDCPSRDRLDAVIDAEMAALDDNTKGAAE